MKLLVFDFYKEMHADMIGTTVTMSESVLLFLLYKSDRMGCNLVETESVSAVGEGKVPFVLKVLRIPHISRDSIGYSWMEILPEDCTIQ